MRIRSIQPHLMKYRTTLTCREAKRSRNRTCSTGKISVAAERCNEARSALLVMDDANAITAVAYRRCSKPCFLQYLRNEWLSSYEQSKRITDSDRSYAARRKEKEYVADASALITLHSLGLLEKAGRVFWWSLCSC